MPRLRAIGLAALALLAGCAPQAREAGATGVFSFPGQQVSAGDLVITLERTPCFGFCPSYKLTAYGDGRLVYEGYRFVGTEGTAEARLEPEQLQALLDAFARAEYFALDDAYTDVRMTDMPSAITSLELGTRRKTVTHYHGDPSAPEALTALEDAIDEITGSARWTESETRPSR